MPTHVMVYPDLMEVRGAESEAAARKYAERVSGRIIEEVTNVGAGLYLIVLR